MSQTEAFATRLPSDLRKKLDEMCELLGLKKSFVVESALREKLEDLMDTSDLQEAIREASGFHSWKDVKKQLKTHA